MPLEPRDVVDFWVQAGAARWYAKDDAFDEEIRRRFEAAHHAAARGEYDGWAQDASGALALLILLDQLPRNLYRDSAHAWATDPKARAVARQAVEQGWHAEVAPDLRQFMLLPFEHSEDVADQDRGLALAEALGDPEIVKWMRIHGDIVRRFGRFPHRNRALGRATTAEEQAFLDDGGFAG